MDFIISLAHFCEVHGPTSILSTQLAPISCDDCYPCPAPSVLSQHSNHTSSLLSDFWKHPESPGFDRLHSPLLESPCKSPSTSPGSYNPYFPGSPPSSHGSRDSFTRSGMSPPMDCDSCDNCTFLVPNDMSRQLPFGAPGSPTKDGQGRHGCPVLRTSQSVVAHAPESEGAEVAAGEETHGKDIPLPENSLRRLLEALHASSPTSGPASEGSSRSRRSLSSYNSHMHTLQYMTRQQPSEPSAYALLRRSCIRTLSSESLPRGSNHGPLYFGDPIAGYTIAYVFRLPDPNARGPSRLYALIALSGTDSWRASSAYVMITKAFSSIAAQILAKADSVLEKESAASHCLDPGPLSTTLPQQSSVKQYGTESVTISPITSPRKISDVSSFLSARKVDPDGFPRVARDVMRAKGLAEIVGKDNFFVELHARFCVILASLVREFSRRH